jgi:hypothetical protein
MINENIPLLRGESEDESAKRDSSSEGCVFRGKINAKEKFKLCNTPLKISLNALSSVPSQEGI